MSDKQAEVKPNEDLNKRLVTVGELTKILEATKDHMIETVKDQIPWQQLSEITIKAQDLPSLEEMRKMFAVKEHDHLKYAMSKDVEALFKGRMPSLFEWLALMFLGLGAGFILFGFLIWFAPLGYILVGLILLAAALYTFYNAGKHPYKL